MCITARFGPSKSTTGLELINALLKACDKARQHKLKYMKSIMQSNVKLKRKYQKNSMSNRSRSPSPISAEEYSRDANSKEENEKYVKKLKKAVEDLFKGIN